MSKAFRAKAKAEREIRGDHVLQYFMLRDYVVELQSKNPNTTVKIIVERNTDPSLPTRVFKRIYVCLGALKLGFRASRIDLLGLDGAFMKGPFPGQVLVACLGDDIDLHLNSNFTFINDRQKGIISSIKTIYSSAEHRYCLRHIHENMKQGWCGQAYKDLLWTTASATNVKDFKKCMLELKTMNSKAREWLNRIPAKHWARSHFSGRAKSDLLLNNICEVFNGKIIRGRDKPVITLLEYIREYCMKRIVNVQGVIDKCTGPLTPTATRIMESIKKEAHLIKVQWNGANKYQVLGSLGDQCVVYVVSMTCSCWKWELTGIPCKHAVATCWNMALNDRAAPPRNLGRPKKKRKRSKHEDEPFVKDGKLSRKGKTITCQLCGNIRHNKATCKGQGRKASTGSNNAEGSGGASRQARQTKPAVGQDGSGGSGVGVVIGLFDTAGEGGAGDPGGAGVASQDMPSEAVEQRMDANVPDEIDGAKGEQVPNHVVKKGNLEFLVCKEVANLGVNELVDKGKDTKKKRV
ncbi:mutator type transposase [Tanacetum coccineum]